MKPRCWEEYISKIKQSPNSFTRAFRYRIKSLASERCYSLIGVFKIFYCNLYRALLAWDVYASVRARIVYAGRLGRSIIEEMINARSLDEAINYLRETDYYQYIRGAPLDNQEALELHLYSGLYRALRPLIGMADKEYRGIVDHVLMFIESRIIVSVLSMLASGELIPLDLGSLEGSVAGGVYKIARDERSLVRALDYLYIRGYKDFVDTYYSISKQFDARKALAIASDLGTLKRLSKITSDYPSLSELVCPEIDYIVIQLLIRLSREKAREHIAVEDLSYIACGISKTEIEDLYGYQDEEAILNILRKIYGPQTVQKDLETSLINIRGYVRKTVRSLCEKAMYSYPFDPRVVWASARIRILDVEDIVSILNGKKAGVSQELLKKAASV